LTDRLLLSPSFARHQAQEFVTLMQVQDGRKGTKGPLQDYLAASFRENKSWDRIFREILVADDNDPKAKGASEFVKARVKDIDRLTIDVSTVFFGVNVSCAQCHDHPHVPAWTQDHFYGLKSFFSRTTDVAGFVGEKDFGFVKYVPNKKPEKTAPVMFLTGTTFDVPGLKEPTKEEKKKDQDRLESAKKAKKIPKPPQFSLRAKLVDVALEPTQQTFFARAIVNRLVYRFLGCGLVMPLDQMHVENPPSHPELLHWLARDLANHQYDLRRLIRGIVLSNTYGRTSRWEGDHVPEAKSFAVAQVRPLSPMQMAVSLKLATMNQQLPLETQPREKRLEELAKGSERLALSFPQPGVNFQVGVGEALLFANNEALFRELLSGPDNLVARLETEPDPAKQAVIAIQTVLSRQAKPEEIQAAVEYLKQRVTRPEQGCQQLVWALLASPEFRFNH
ncbi:MAG TPA: DUF1553 domain-containing protein, partial [Gemmataceae bacterium]|nr:DUF1553 domain-containing protein [Gemmataceae bacterium]